MSATHRPSPDENHTTHWLTTDEVYLAIKKLDPSANISKEQLFQALRDAGYQFRSRPGANGLDFRWMMSLR